MADEIKQLLADEEKLNQVVKHAFDFIDKDGSGTICGKELGAAMNELTKGVEGVSPPSESDINNTMKALDTDGNGKLDKKEFKDFVVALFQAIAASV